MSNVMTHLPDRSLATRASLLERLRDCANQASWQEFYDIYRDLIFRFALKRGCTETEADEVVQETVIGVARKLPDYRYDPKVCSFKTWLLNLTLWRVKDQIRKRAKAGDASGLFKSIGTTATTVLGHPLDSDETRRTASLEGLPDPAMSELEAVWEQEWRQAALEAAMERVKKRANLKDCQMFDLYMLRGLPARQVARMLRVNVARVYLAKHRIRPLLKRAVKEIEKSGL